jgi:putative permease
MLVAIAKIDNLLVSMILAFVTSYMLAPTVDFLERRGFSRKWATVLPFLAVIIVASFGLQLFFPTMVDQMETLKINFPKYLQVLTDLTTRMESEVGGFIRSVYPVDIQSALQPKLISWAATFFQDLPNYISKSLMISLLAPLLAFFMLLDGRQFVRTILTLVPNNFFELALNLNHQIGSQIGGFIRARFVQSALVALVIWIGLMILNFPYALVLAIAGGILNVIPYLGPLIAVLPPLLISLSGGTNGGELAWIAMIYGTAQVLDATLITPFVVAKIIDLHPITVILVIIVGSQLMGVLGMIICIPIFSALKVSTIAIYKHLTDFRS